MLATVIFLLLTCSFFTFSTASASPDNLGVLPGGDVIVKSSSSRKKKDHIMFPDMNVGSDENYRAANVCVSVPIINTIPIASADKERFPRDLLLEGDEKCIKFIQSKSKKRRSPTTAFYRLLERKDFMSCVKRQVLWDKLCLLSKPIEALKILNSPNFHGIGFDRLNHLPFIYMEFYAFSHFEAFLRRFQYEDEYLEIFKEFAFPDYESPESSLTTPFLTLVLIFLKPEISADPRYEKFFALLVETQQKAFRPSEFLYFDYWLRGGPSTWKYLRIYFETSGSPDQSYNLAMTLLQSSFYDLITDEMIQFILSIEAFNVNVRLDLPTKPSKSDESTSMKSEVLGIFNDEVSENESKSNQNETSSSQSNQIPLFHRIIYDSKHSKLMLSHVMKHPNLNVLLPTGKLIFQCQGCLFEAENLPIILLAVLLGNAKAFNLLYCHPVIRTCLDPRLVIVLLLKYAALIFWARFQEFFMQKLRKLNLVK